MPKETRTIPLKEFRAEEREDGAMILEGYAAVFDTPTVLFKDADGTEYKEVIDRNAFAKTDMKKCCMKYNHESAFPVMARVRGGSLEVSVDDYGLKFRANLFNTQSNRDIYEIVKAGGIDECSFAFSMAPNGDYYDKSTRTRVLKDFEVLWDVSVVDHPAYTEGTSVSARSYLEAEAEKDALEKAQALKEAEERNRKLKLIKLAMEVNNEN